MHVSYFSTDDQKSYVCRIDNEKKIENNQSQKKKKGGNV